MQKVRNFRRMSYEIIIAPSILSADFANLEKEIKSLEGASWVHIDVMDGHFVPNITIGAPVVKSLRNATDKILDVHLMIENPEKYIPDFAKAKSDLITFHYETIDEEKIIDIIELIHSYNIKAGLSIKPKTPPEKVFPYLNRLDMVLIMTVEPGFGGQCFMEECASKIKIIREQNSDIIIEVDGGINKKTAKICKDFGANALVAGSYIFSASDRKEAIKSLI